MILGSISSHFRATPLHHGTWLDWKSSQRHIDAEIREGRAEKNGRKSVSVRARRNYIRVTRFCLVESRGYNTRSVQHFRHLFDAGQIRLDVVFSSFFFFKGEEPVRIFLFPFDDFAIELINTARKGIWILGNFPRFLNTLGIISRIDIW